ncbi:MAG: hypothetical protein C4562_06075 [Actinobacteria bacterium]|nr:MAG: hypothetical protein C4562_06075 [Actinomycetota bacterium]
MALEEMLKALDEAGREDCKKLKADGKRIAKQIIKEAELERDRFIEHHLEKARVTAALKKAKIINNANFELKKDLIRAKEDMMSKLFAKIGEEAKKIRKSPNYKDVFEKLAAESISSLNSKVKAYVDPSDESLARQALSRLDVEYQILPTIKTVGGLKASSEDGKITVNNTLESRLKKASSLLKTEVFKLLFGEA